MKHYKILVLFPVCVTKFIFSQLFDFYVGIDFTSAVE